MLAPSVELAQWYIQARKYTANTKDRSIHAIENRGRNVFKKSLDTFSDFCAESSAHYTEASAPKRPTGAAVGHIGKTSTLDWQELSARAGSAVGVRAIRT